MGDAMRDLDKRGLLQGDFLVVYGDLVASLDLAVAMERHKKRREEDKNAIMTMVLREADKKHQQGGGRDVFVIDPTKDRCVHYEAMGPGSSGRLNIDPDLLAQHEELEIRTDLLDTGIDICTPDVLALWSDNFDFQVPRKGFLYSVLKDYELNGKTIHVHVEREKYAQRAKTLRAYADISTDLVRRWAWPFTPDANLVAGQSYKLRKDCVYEEDGVVLARSCHIGQATMLGKGTSIGEDTIIENSVIGRNCIIGRNANIQGAYIWNNANIGDGSIIQQAIIADEAAIGRRCIVGRGVLIAHGVRISDGMVVQSQSRITRTKRKHEDDEELEKGEPNSLLVGEGGEGFEYVDEDEDEDDTAEGLVGPSLLYNMSNLALSAESISTLNDEDDMSDEIHAPRDRSAGGSFTSIGSDDSTTWQAAAAARDFHHEAYTSILDSLNRGDDSANIQLELSALKLSANASEHQVRRAVVTAIVRFISQQLSSGTALSAAVDKLLPQFKALLERTMFDHNLDAKGDQVDFMLLLQSECIRQEKGEDILARMTYKLSVEEVIEDDGLEQWWESEKSAEQGQMARVRGKTEKIVEAVVGDDESEEEEDSEEEG